jgi:hypothetical protein
MDLLIDVLQVHLPKAVEAVRPYWVLIVVGVVLVVLLKLLLSTLLPLLDHDLRPSTDHNQTLHLLAVGGYRSGRHTATTVQNKLFLPFL